MKRKIALCFMSVGLCFVLFSLALLVYNNYESKKAQQSSAALMDSILNMVTEEDTAVVDPFDEEMTVKEIDGYGYVGYLTIPALNIDLPVMSECDYTRLKISPCRYYGSTKTNNFVIAAHSHRYHFGYIGKLKEGDVVSFTDMDGKVYSYAVRGTELLLPTDVDKVKDSGDDLILYTCNYGGTKRVTVRCTLIASK